MKPLPYELCRELKDAEFPQRESAGDLLTLHPEQLKVGHIKGYTGYGCGFLYEDEKGNSTVYSPTFEELIEEVKKLRLKITLNGFENHWNAHCSTTESASGSTPSEAVARLWLALQDKK